MENAKPKSYSRLVEYVRQEIFLGHLKPGDRLPTERDLALQLDISRNSIREGLKSLQNMGVISPSQGSGNYISTHFKETISELLTFLYFLKGMSEADVTEYRWMIERAALVPAARRISAQEKEQLLTCLARLEAAETEQEQMEQDRLLHEIIVRASRNDFLVANYEALTSFMDSYISTMRQRIIRGLQGHNDLELAHRLLAEGIVQGDPHKAEQGLIKHYGYIEKYSQS